MVHGCCAKIKTNGKEECTRRYFLFQNQCLRKSLLYILPPNSLILSISIIRLFCVLDQCDLQSFLWEYSQSFIKLVWIQSGNAGAVWSAPWAARSVGLGLVVRVQRRSDVPSHMLLSFRRVSVGASLFQTLLKRKEIVWRVESVAHKSEGLITLNVHAIRLSKDFSSHSHHCYFTVLFLWFHKHLFQILS